MNSLNSLYFPGTIFHSTSQYPLFLLFSTLHLLRVAEHNIHGSCVQATDSFIKSGLCRVHTPSPLGNDLERFINLINDIKNRKDEYASQLSALTLAAMSPYPGKGDSDSRQEIISALLNNEQLYSGRQKEQKTLELWQARLVLAIGEILDCEEEDIARQLAAVKDEEAELFKELQGKEHNPEDENPFEELLLIRENIAPPTSGNIQKRFLSWKQLYREGSLTCDLLLTTSRDTADRILESFSTESCEKTVYSGQLSLPAIVSRHEDDAIQRICSFREKNKVIIDKIREQLVDLKTDNSPAEENNSREILSSYREPWEESLQSHFPAKEFGRIPLSFYCFTSTPCSTLLGTDSQDSNHINGLMAIADITAGRI